MHALRCPSLTLKFHLFLQSGRAAVEFLRLPTQCKGGCIETQSGDFESCTHAEISPAGQRGL